MVTKVTKGTKAAKVTKPRRKGIDIDTLLWNDFKGKCGTLGKPIRQVLTQILEQWCHTTVADLAKGRK